MKPAVITQLRDFVPIRPLRYSEALRIAELQAQRFLAFSGIMQPAVPERMITELPKIHVTRLSPFPASGATHWSEGRWLIVLNGAEPLTRQRFSLAHELKHIIDHRFVDIIYSGFPERERPAMVEQICDFFAGCLLMPRPWMKESYCGGMQFLPDLARKFGVSQAAIAVRLNQIGLGSPQPRCGGTKTDWTYEAIKKFTSKPTYRRLATTII